MLENQLERRDSRAKPLQVRFRNTRSGHGNRDKRVGKLMKEAASVTSQILRPASREESDLNWVIRWKVAAGGDQVCSRGEFSVLPASLMLFSSALAQTNAHPDNTRLTFPLLPSVSQTQKAVTSNEFPHPLFFCSTQVAFTLYFVFVHYLCIHYPHN